MSNKIEPEPLQKVKVKPLFQADPKSYLLGSDPYRRSDTAVALAELLLNHVEAPFTIAVQGEWGSGKSVFLDLILQAVSRAETPKNRVEIIKVDAYEFETLGNLAYPLIREVLKRAPLWFKVWRGVSRLFRFLTSLVIWIFLKLLDIDVKYLDAATRGKTSESSYKNLEKEYKTVTDVRRDFDRITMAISRSKRKKKILIVIDELDRCSGLSILSLIDSIRNYLSNTKCVFLIAVDYKAVHAALTTRYGNDTIFSGEEYLRKIVGFSIELGMSPDEFCEVSSQTYKTNFPALVNQDEIRFLKNYFALQGSSNLRGLTRILDRYVLAKTVISRKEVSEELTDRVILFVCFIYEMQRELYEDVKKYTNYAIIDEIPKLDFQNRDYDPEKLPYPRQLLVRKYCTNSPVRDQISFFRKSLVGDVHPRVVKAIGILETLK